MSETSGELNAQIAALATTPEPSVEERRASVRELETESIEFSAALNVLAQLPGFELHAEEAPKPLEISELMALHS